MCDDLQNRISAFLIRLVRVCECEAAQRGIRIHFNERVKQHTLGIVYGY